LESGGKVCGLRLGIHGSNAAENARHQRRERTESAQERAGGVGDDVGHAGSARRNPVLQDFDGEAEKAAENGGDENRSGEAALLLEPGAEEKAERHEADDVAGNVVDVLPGFFEFLARRAEETLVGDSK